jgi:hypothetical protein
VGNILGHLPWWTSTALPSYVACPFVMTRPLLAPLLASSLLAAGCGPIQTTAWMMDAEVALNAAKTAGAVERSPYELAAAELYLHKCREELGYSEYELAVEYARKATRHAQEARERALKAAKGTPSKP